MDYPRNYSGIIDQGNEKGGKPYINSFTPKLMLPQLIQGTEI
jgi:hypothetical protein